MKAYLWGVLSAAIFLAGLFFVVFLAKLVDWGGWYDIPFALSLLMIGVVFYCVAVNLFWDKVLK